MDARSLDVLRRAIPPPLDALLGLVLAFATQAELWLQADRVEGSSALQAAAFAVATLAVAWRRRSPLLVVTVVFAALSVQTMFAGDAPIVGGFIAAIIAVYSVAAHAAGRNAAIGAAIVALALAATLVDPDERALADIAANYLIFAVIWALGWALRGRRRRAEELEERGALLERQREAKTREAVAAERARIARELHDVVAHNVSVMVLQAGAARQVLDGGQDAVRDALLSVEHKGREALDEMRRLLGILRDDEDALSLAPQPNLGDLPALVTQMQRAGLPVQLAIEGERGGLSAGLELTVYRIVQEALTNTLKHAGQAQASVVVRLGERAVEVEVADDGRGTGRSDGDGHGLVGLRERAALYGGTLEAGARPDSGFTVRAVLPRDAQRS